VRLRLHRCVRCAIFEGKEARGARGAAGGGERYSSRPATPPSRILCYMFSVCENYLAWSRTHSLTIWD
jgi:hypothetical protein